ncbi:MAG TPA: ATP-dependent DNA helicase RecG [Coriobacteriia bacterium]
MTAQPKRPAADRVARLAAHDRPVTEVRFVDPTRAEALGRIGIETVGDLLRHYPSRWLDLRTSAPLAHLPLGQEATAVGTVHEVVVKRPRPRLSITEVAITDDTGVLVGVWFNQPYLAQRFRPGDRVAFAGVVQMEFGLRQMRSPFVERLGSADDATWLGRILPVHPATEGLSSNWIRRLVAEALDEFGDYPDPLPVAVRVARGLVPHAAALHDIHFPPDMAARDAARRRLAYEELLMLQLGMASRRHALVQERKGFRHVVDGKSKSSAADALPFSLTGDQERALAEILSDMASPRPMNRMLLGDVGTGKTAVAALALAAGADSHTQAAMMAPTEVLARQYSGAVGPLLDAAGVSWRLLTGSTPAPERREILTGLASGEVSVAFGTHALLTEAVEFKALTLAIVDEQHRFGVTQRLALRGKGSAVDLLVMTATPIPRSLALTVYGDLDASYLREHPRAGARQRVLTRLVPRSGRDEAYDVVRAAVRAGRQAYVVCALVDDSEATEAKAAIREAERLRTRVFRDLRVGLLTGQMRPSEKTAAMEDFRAGRIDVLVATTVIEVGVDVPNATVMIVEDAERFGLAQLHQLRGRVGRGGHGGEVLLFADPKTSEARARMEAFVTTTDGFELAERDLLLRGEGQLLGERQHGLAELRLASIARDIDLIAEAREDAQGIVSHDPHLTDARDALLLEEMRRSLGRDWEWVRAG